MMKRSEAEKSSRRWRGENRGCGENNGFEITSFRFVEEEEKEKCVGFVGCKTLSSQMLVVGNIDSFARGGECSVIEYSKELRGERER